MSTGRCAVVLEGERVALGVRRVRLRALESDRLGHRAGQYILLHARAADGSGQNVLAAGIIVQLQGGQYKVVWPKKFATAEPIWPTPACHPLVRQC